MAGIGADTEAIQQASVDIDEARNAVEQALQQLQGQLEGPVQNWKGAAADVFRKLMEQYEQSGKTIIQKLDELGQNVQSSGQDYAQVQEEQAQEISKITSMLDG
ncbi:MULTISPECIES: WXG100 family type VII secretion target [Saccharopolyspora]|jgi:WXG100 family type VII secretion target|uniref:ESAT-6-like protein n=3 Tax=Saccharopolyspora TaxID=1835 RepID=A0A4R4VTS0_9PSEU|nr:MULTISPECIES: WXG100 family type VII secretion target [Saccharopolyspora]MBQ0922917.1 WXG100 family type VII secretion target [Saccharopolyspora endophytica]TDC91160.1 WXG100 family type VII secretion target [Saccharopolyspora aridisoli]TDD03670.1 WXG100 family type VII secretion target [Saccharopolyspora terrae]